MTTLKQDSTLMATIMKDVSQALKYDRKGQNEEAYRKYLECVLRISTALLKNLHADGGHVVVSPDRTKMVKLGQQCMDRVSAIQASRSPAVSPSTSSSSLPVDQGSQKGLQSHPPSPSSSTESPAITRPRGPSLDLSSVKRHGQKQMSPIEMAERQNKQLLVAFKARQSRQSKDRTRAINLSLTLQRKMAENLAIAKVQEGILAQKMLERQKRLEEQAALRFGAPLGLTEEDLYQRQVYKKVLEFEQEELWMVDLRKKITENPTNIDVISSLVTAILQCDSHPLTEELGHYQARILDKISPLLEGHSGDVELLQVPLSDKQMKELLTEIPEIPSVAVDESLLEESVESEQMHAEQSLESRLENKESLNEKCKSDVPESSQCPIKNECEEDKTVDTIVCEGENSSKITVDIVDNKNETDIPTDVKTERKKDAAENFAEATSELKHDIEKSLSLYDNEKDRLEKQIKTLTKQITTDYEQYNQDNLDDLFDDDEDDVGVGCLDNSMTQSAAGTCSLDNMETGTRAVKHSETATLDGDKSAKSLSTESGDVQERNNSNVGVRPCSRFTNLDSRILKLTNEAYNRHLKGIIDDVLTSIEKVQVLFLIVFEELGSAEGRDQCNVLLEEFFFRPIWARLRLLFRLANRPKEILLARQMTQQLRATPADLFVREELCLSLSVSADGPASLPYESAIQEVRAVVNCHTMLEKLECLVRSTRLVVHCVEQHYKQMDEDIPSIGADDLLPVLSYLVVKSCLPQLISECQAMDRLIHEGYMMGEEGYCLTSFQTAINFLITEGFRQTEGM